MGWFYNQFYGAWTFEKGDYEAGSYTEESLVRYSPRRVLHLETFCVGNISASGFFMFILKPVPTVRSREVDSMATF